MDGDHVHVLLPDGTEEVWPLGHLVGQLQGVERLHLLVVDGDLEIVPVYPEMVLA